MGPHASHGRHHGRGQGWGAGFAQGFPPGFPPGAGPEAIWQAMGQMRGGFERKMGSRMGRGDVRAAALVLLAEEPMHGYQIIKAIEERTQGRWRPSAGSVYPTLQLLADEGLVSTQTEQDRKIYSLTETGKEAAAAATAPWGDDEECEPKVLGAIPKAGMDLAQAVGQALRTGNAAQHEQVVEVLDAARRKVYAILAQD